MDSVEILIGAKLGRKDALASVPIGVLANPADARVEDGDTAIFSVTALGENLSYQWQYSVDGGTTWADSSEESATTATLSFATDEAYDEYKFRCVVSGDGGSVTSAAATLYFYIPLAITTQPVNFVGAVGDTATFTVGATGTDLTYQWQYSSNGGKNWYTSTLTGNKTDTLTMEFTEARLVYQYRCRITDKFNDQIFSDPVRLIKSRSGTFTPSSFSVDLNHSTTSTITLTYPGSGEPSFSPHINNLPSGSHTNLSIRDKSVTESDGSTTVTFKIKLTVSGTVIEDSYTAYVTVTVPEAGSYGSFIKTLNGTVTIDVP